MGIFIWDLEGAIVEANEAFLRMVQYSREDVVSGRVRWTDLTPPEWRESDQQAVAETKGDRQSATVSKRSSSGKMAAACLC